MKSELSFHCNIFNSTDTKEQILFDREKKRWKVILKPLVVILQFLIDCIELFVPNNNEGCTYKMK